MSFVTNAEKLTENYRTDLTVKKNMKHKVKVKVPVKKKGLFGTKTVTETRIIEVDDKTYRQMKEKDEPYSIEEMILYDEIFDD